MGDGRLGGAETLHAFSYWYISVSLVHMLLFFVFIE